MPDLLFFIFLSFSIVSASTKQGQVIIFISFFALAVDRFKFLTDFSLIFSWQGLP
jgi:hypothetical protein